MKRFAASYVYTLESVSPLRNAFVETDDNGRILRTGLCGDINSEPAFYDGAIVPGFVNSHCHLELSHLKGKFVKGSGMSGFINQINSLRDSEDRQTRLSMIKSWADRLWEQGVSAVADISNCDDSFEIKKGSPVYFRTFLEVFGTEPGDCSNVIASVLELKKEADAIGIDAAPTPHSCYTMSPELLTAASSEALRSGYLSYHSQESPQEDEMIRYGTGELAENYRGRGLSTPPVSGKSSLMYFIDRISKVHEPPFDEHILLVHNVTLSEQDIEAAASVMKNVYWAICPLSNIFIHNQLPPVRLMREKNLKITVGTDSLSSNDTLDIVSELFCLQRNFPEIPLGEMLGWACLNGAAFLSIEKTAGSISAGKTPGLVLLGDLDAEGRLTSGSRSVRLI